MPLLGEATHPSFKVRHGVTGVRHGCQRGGHSSIASHCGHGVLRLRDGVPSRLNIMTQSNSPPQRLYTGPEISRLNAPLHASTWSLNLPFGNETISSSRSF